MIKKFRLLTAGLITTFALVATLSMFNKPVAAAGIDSTPDCDNTAIIYCGVTSVADLKAKYAENKPGDLPAVYKAFNITNFDGLVEGAVMRDGTVVYNGKVIATGAMTAARNMPGGDIAGSEANIISPSVWPAQYITGKPAYIKIVDGKFAYAVLKTCGNPIKATPVTPPPAPVATCVKVTPIKIDRNHYDFKGEATAANGAKITGYTFVITHSSGTGKIINVTSSALSATSGSVQLEDGTHTVKLTVRTSLGDRNAPACEATVTVPAEQPNTTQVCNPVNGETITVDEKVASQYKPVGDIACTDVKVCNPKTGNIETVKKAVEGQYEKVDSTSCQHVEAATTTLPSTGPTDMLMGGAGVSSLTAAGYYWRASRRRFLSTMLNR